MNKGDFINLMSQNSGLSKSETEKCIDLFTNCIIEAYRRGEEVNLIGFGSFNLQQRAAREGRNPRTGEKINVDAYNHPSFKAGKKLKDACN